jgi:hypothetical protein
MPLRSLMLKDDAALQKCLVSDSAHVIPGAAGPHVSKIQKVLMLADRARIAENELRARAYGTTSANAVLAYKRARGIINRAYQTVPDNIVGKMTIKRLDKDMLDLESRKTLDHTACGADGGGTVVAAVRDVVGGPNVIKNQKAVVSIVWQQTTAAEQIGGVAVLAKQILAQARELAKPHGITITGPDDPAFGKTVPDFEKVIPGSPASCFSVRESAERIIPGDSGKLRVIICPFSDKASAFGVTDGGTLDKVTFNKFCLINLNNPNPDKGTLLHEMIHAAKPIFVDHDNDDPTSVFAAGTARDHLPTKHATSIVNAFYSTKSP